MNRSQVGRGMNRSQLGVAGLSCLLLACGSKPQTQPLPAQRPVEPGAGPVVAARPTKPKPGANPSTPTQNPDAKQAPKPDAKPAPKPDAKPTAADSVAQPWLDAHNAVRAKHCAAPLTWSPKLAEVAQSWASSLAKQGCMFGHSPGAKYGENLAAGTIGALDPSSTVGMWYDEIKLYKFPNGGFSAATGHFTQVVWRSTREVGCGHVQCKGNDIYVCNYDPPGNWEGKYREEVLPTGCKK